MQPGKCYKYFLFLALAALFLLGGNAFGDTKDTYLSGVYFNANFGDNSIDIEGLTGDAESETIVFPIKMKLDNTVGVGQNVSVIRVYMTYDNTKFTFEGADQADGLGFSFYCATCGEDNGVIQLSLTSGTKPTSDFYDDYVTIANITIKAKCQPVNTWHTIDFSTEIPLANEIITSLGDEYAADDPEELVNKYVIVEREYFYVGSTYDSYVGAMGTIIEVPVKLWNDTYIDELGFSFTYDGNKLEYLGIIPDEIYFPNGPTPPGPEPGDNPVTLHFRSPVGPLIEPHPEGIEILKVRFLCKYDVSFWDGTSTNLTFPTEDVIIGIHQYLIGSCPDALQGSWVYGGSGSVTIPAYTAEFNAQTTDRIFQNDAEGVNFDVTVNMKNNFPAGLGEVGAGYAEDAKIRVDFSFTEEMNAHIQDPYQAANPDPENPLDDFYFTFNTGGTKGTAVNVEYYTRVTEGFDNFRDIQPDFQPLLQFPIELDGGWDEPVSYSDRDFSIPFTCSFQDRAARVIDTTGIRSVECGTGYTPGTIDFEYAVGKVYSTPVTVTEPSNATQYYYLYGNFDIEDFEVVVIKSGPHDVVGYNSVDGVDASFNGTDQITFTKNASWEPADGSGGILIGYVIYNNYDIPQEIEEEPFTPQRSIGPGITWCYHTTTISYGASTFIAGDNGRLSWLYNVANPVRSRFDCSPHVDPGDDDIEPRKQGLPDEFRLTANYPNPFNPTTTVAFELPQASPVKIEIFNLLGQKVTTLVDGYREAGRFEVVWNGKDEAGRQVSSGIYFCRMTAGDYTGTLKMMMMK